MLRATVLVFVAGWVCWFWLDKPPLPPGLPGGADQLITNFQFAFSLLKKGYFSEAYVFIWRAHYLVLSLLGGLLVRMAVSGVSQMVARRRYAIRARRQMPQGKGEPGAVESGQPVSKQDL